MTRQTREFNKRAKQIKELANRFEDVAKSNPDAELDYFAERAMIDLCQHIDRGIDEYTELLEKLEDMYRPIDVHRYAVLDEFGERITSVHAKNPLDAMDKAGEVLDRPGRGELLNSWIDGGRQIELEAI